MNKLLKNTLKLIFRLFILGISLFIILLIYLSITEYKPNADEILYKSEKVQYIPDNLSVLSWNIGYAGLDDKNDFFMDGGTKVLSRNSNAVYENLDAISSFIENLNPSFIMLQEVDRPSKRTFYINEDSYLTNRLNKVRQFAHNYKVDYIPYPFPPLGYMESGLYTASEFLPNYSERKALYVPFKFPVKLVNLKRGLLINRYKLPNGKDFVLINLHLEAYDDGEGKKAQSQMLFNLIKDEYDKGNYVIAGGDWNQSFIEKNYFKQNGNYNYKPKPLDENSLPEGFKFVYDPDTPTNRVNNKPYNVEDPECIVGLIDGFAVSSNIKIKQIKTYSLNFKNSDHNPVLLKFKFN